ncbi:MAG: hypothetical protein ACO2Y4_05435 [Burkholderiaceae bacterium]|jgi:hypothetical protein
MSVVEPMPAFEALSSVITGEPLYVGAVQKRNGYHQFFMSNNSDMTDATSKKKKLIGVWNLSHLSQKEAFLVVREVAVAVKNVREMGVSFKNQNEMISYCIGKEELFGKKQNSAKVLPFPAR